MALCVHFIFGANERLSDHAESENTGLLRTIFNDKTHQAIDGWEPRGGGRDPMSEFCVHIVALVTEYPFRVALTAWGFKAILLYCIC